MQIVSSYGVEINKKNIPLRSTLGIFRKAVSYLIPMYAETWEDLLEISNPTCTRSGVLLLYMA